MIYGTPDAAEAIDSLAGRVHNLEMGLTSPSVVGGGSVFQTITIGGVVVRATVTAPTNLVLTPGTFFDRIFLDASWTASTGTDAVGYEVELAKKNVAAGTYQLQQVYPSGANNLRIEPLEPQTTYGVRVFAVNRLGIRSTPLPATGWTDVTTGSDATIPAVVSGLIAGAGFTTVTISWAEATEQDVRFGAGLYEVVLATNSAFTTGVQTRRVSATIVTFGNLSTGVTYYYKVAAIDSSGNIGPFSATGSVTTASIGAADVGPIGGGNMLRDSSFEDGSGWSLNAAGGVTFVGTYLKHGVRAARCVTGTTSDRRLISRADTLVQAGMPYVISAWVYLEPGWDGGKVYPVPFGFEVPTIIRDCDPALTGIYQRVIYRYTMHNADGTPFPSYANAYAGGGQYYLKDIRIVHELASAGGKVVHVDAMQVELGEIPTAYAPKPDEVLPNTITATEIGPNSISTGALQANAVVAAKIAAGQVNTDHIIAAGIDAAVVKFGVMHGDRIQVATLNASRLVSSSITTADLTLAGGSIRSGNPPTTGLLINSQGLHLYAGGTRTVFLDATTGNGSFTGTITGSNINGGTITGALYKSAATGERIEISNVPVTVPGPNGNLSALAIRFFPDAGGADPYAPGQFWSDITADGSYLVARAPRYSNVYGEALLQLQSGITGFGNEARAILQVNNPVGLISPSLELNTRPHEVNLFDGGNFNVFANLSVGGGYTKNFRIPHPLRAGHDLVHSTLEGPEAAVYYRGTARAVNGRVVVTLPTYFEALTSVEGRTVLLTPVGVLAVVAASRVQNGRFTITADRDCEIDWEVKAVRADVIDYVTEPLTVERPARPGR